MTDDETHRLLALHHEPQEQWLLALLARSGSRPPALLDVALALPRICPDAAMAGKRLVAAAQTVFGAYELGDLAEVPTTLVERALAQILWGQQVPVAVPESNTTADPALTGVRDAWLRRSSEQHLHRDPSQRWAAPPDLGEAARCELPVLLTGEQRHQGVVATLTLQLVHQPHAHLAFVPAPSSALLLQTPLFARTLHALSESLRQTLRAPAKGAVLPPLQDLAIAWDLCPLSTGVPLSLAHGDSAGAAFAVGALKLLAEAAPAPWQRHLRRITRTSLKLTAVTAALRGNWTLGAVGGVNNKSEALLPLASAMADAGRRLRLHVAHDQPEGSLPFHAHPPEMVHHRDFDALLQALAEACSPMNDAQHALLKDLLASRANEPPQPPDRLEAVLAAPAPTLTLWLLRCWAQWEQAARVQATFVPLEVQDNALGDKVPRIQGQSFTSIRQLLDDFDPRGLHDAYLLNGAPGAGKSTLLRHHLQQLCREALQAIERGQQPAQLPVLVPLLALPENETDPVAWLRRRLHAEQAPDEVLHLLQGAAASAPRTVPRLMLDGLNELPMADPRQRPQRAAVVVAAFRQALRAAPPLLLTVRPHHIGELPGLRLLRVEVQAWDDEGIRRYLMLRFPQNDKLWRQHAQALLAVPAVAELSRTPLYLSGYADLLEAGFTEPPSDRAALFSAWLWQRLRRALGLQPGHAAVPEVQALLRDPLLLTADDHAAIAHPSAWRTTRLRDLPAQGLLVRGLQQQAEDQWWADAAGGRRSAERGGVAVKWSQAALWLRDAKHPPGDPQHDAPREAWGRAVSALGLVVIDRVHDTYAFSHQAWGEWLASTRLLQGQPPPLPLAVPWYRRLAGGQGRSAQPVPLPQALSRLLAELERSRWPQPGTRRDIDELRHQQADAGAAWEGVPPGVWQALLADGLDVDAEDLMVARYGQRSRNFEPLRRDFAVWFSDQTWTLDEATGRCLVNLQTWGDTTNIRSQFGTGWNERPAAWQVFIHNGLWGPFRQACWKQLERLLPDDTVAELQKQPGGLALPPPGEVDEVLALALAGAARPAAWLTWLLQHGHWQPLRPALLALQQRLEGGPSGAWRDDKPPDPVLQHLRRMLLLTLADNGAAARRPLRRAGVLALLQANISGLPAALQVAWLRSLRTAFKGRGVDLRLRWLAGDMLGRLGDNLRYELVHVPEAELDGVAGAGAFRTGLRPKASQWACIGQAGSWPWFRIGQRHGFDDETPTWPLHLPAFEASRYAVTVAEWRYFVEGGGYASAQAPWWQTAGPAAQAWLEQVTSRRSGRYEPPALASQRHASLLQPMVAITAFEARAFAAWADAFYAAERAAEARAGHKPQQLQIPTEVHWEASVRGAVSRWVWWPATQWKWPHSRQRAPAAIAFNHSATRCAGPTPVGMFAAAASPAGLFDAAGNVWEWCSNALPAELLAQAWRSEGARRRAGQAIEQVPDMPADQALRGGSFNATAVSCRVACRDHQPPGVDDYSIGLRLVRCVLPHSEP